MARLRFRLPKNRLMMRRKRKPAKRGGAYLAMNDATGYLLMNAETGKLVIREGGGG